MKLKFFFCGLLSCFYAISAQATDVGLSLIKQRHYVACGISSAYTSLAYKKDGAYRGLDADLCRAFAAATLGNSEAFQLIPVQRNEVRKAFDAGKIDVLLGHTNLLPAEEASLYVFPVDTIYIDRLVFVSRTPAAGKSMMAYREEHVCVLANSPESVILKDYNQKHAMRFKFLESSSLQSLKENFWLKRCSLLFSNEILARTLIQNPQSAETPEVLPAQITYLPVSAYTDAQNATLNIALRSIINALKQASVANIRSQNIHIFAATKNESIQKLLGINPSSWQKLGLEPTWLQDYVKTYDSYSQILRRDLNVELDIDLRYNRLFNDGGILPYQIFF